MLIRKNTKSFKTILAIVEGCQNRPDRGDLIRLFITKAGHSIRDRMSIEGIQGGAALFYEMNYQAVLNNLKSPNHQLHQSDDVPGIYFFHSASNKVWDETPFEFDESVRKVFGTLPELPVFRKKEKAEKIVFPAPKAKSGAEVVKKEKGVREKTSKARDNRPKQPDYKLRHSIEFTNLAKLAYRQSPFTKKDVLDYYSKISECILPYLKDRPQQIQIREEGGRNVSYTNIDSLSENGEVPGWITTAIRAGHEDEGRALLCNDKEHLLFYVEKGCLRFDHGLSRVKSFEFPDYFVIALESPDTSLDKVVEAALAANEILSGLRLPSFVKTDGGSGLHIYVPLDSKSDFTTCRSAAEFVCKLIRLKVPDLVAIEGGNGYSYGKVSLDYQMNDARGSVIAPYSLVPGSSPVVATPVLWEEVGPQLQPAAVNHETIFERIKQIGDPFAALFKKKVNAQSLLERLQDNYAFLF